MWLRSIYSNKLTYFLNRLKENYLGAFATNFLFTYGETSASAGIYGITDHGVLHLLNLPFLLIGICVLLSQKKYRYVILLILSGILLAPLPSAFTADRSYAIRCIMLLPFLTFATALVLFTVVEQLSSVKQRKRLVLFAVGVTGLYMVLISNYLYQYFYRFPVDNAERWFQSTKDLIEYVNAYRSLYDRVIIASHGDPFMQYSYYNRVDPKIFRQVSAQPLPWQIGNVFFSADCQATNDLPVITTGKQLYIVPDRCAQDVSPTRTITDTAEPLRIIWKIYDIQPKTQAEPGI